MSKKLMKGNEAIAMGAILGGCEAFFGYPITPQNEVPELLSKYMHEHNKVFVQAESEISAINMVYGASGAGARVMTSSSSPGIALKQEGITYLCGAMLPCVIVNVMRGGPGLGGIQPAQSDYFQITRGGGNGDYRVISYAPENLQETVNIMKEVFDIADYYRNPVMVAVDGLIGQMMEPVDLDMEVKKRVLQEKTWATTSGHTDNDRRYITSLFLDPEVLYQHNISLQKKYKEIENNEVRYELINMENADYVIVAYGSMARICRSVILILKERGINVGIIRPITLWPFPKKPISELKDIKKIIVCEMSMGQMIDDVMIANTKQIPISFFGRSGGVVPEPNEIADFIEKEVREV